MEEVQSNKYLKLWRQKNNTHEGDRENSRSILSNLDYSAIKNQKYRYMDSELAEPELDIGAKTLIGLGQVPINQEDSFDQFQRKHEQNWKEKFDKKLKDQRKKQEEQLS